MSVVAVNAAEIPHTSVEVRATEMPTRRALSGLPAAARTMSPNRVRVMIHASRTTRIGTAISTLISRAVTCSSGLTCQLQSLGTRVGKSPPGGTSGSRSAKSRIRKPSSWRDPDRGHQQHESRRAGAAARRRVLEPADDQYLDGHRDDRGERHRHDQARPETPPVLRQQAEEPERDGAERDDGEVHDAAGPVDEDEPGGDGAVGEADHRTGEHHLLRDVPAVDVDHRAVLPPCIRGWHAARAARPREASRTIHSPAPGEISPRV